MKPNKERIKLWVEALRSGKFKQGKNYLRDENDRCCCLGVLCEVAIAHGVPLKMSYEEAENEDYDSATSKRAVAYRTGNGSKNQSTLPLSVQRWAGLGEDNPTLSLNGRDFFEAAEMNDGLGYGFKRIASAIERTYLTEDPA